MANEERLSFRLMFPGWTKWILRMLAAFSFIVRISVLGWDLTHDLHALDIWQAFIAVLTAAFLYSTLVEWTLGIEHGAVRVGYGLWRLSIPFSNLRDAF